MGNQESQDKFEKGDIIKRPMPNSGGFGYHYGVYMGNGRVIHLTKYGGIEECSLEEFAGSPEVEIFKETVSNARTPDEIADSAQTLYKNREEWGSYNLLTNNCEHFALKCATGQKYSSQVKKAHTIATGTSAAVQIGACIVKGIQNGPIVSSPFEYRQPEDLFSSQMPEPPRTMDSFPDFDPRDTSMLSKVAYDEEPPQRSVKSYQSMFPSLRGLDLSTPISNDDVWGSISSDNMRSTVMNNSHLFKF